MKKGFTLTEVLIVVGILVILIVISIPFFRTQIFKSNDARRKAETRRIGIAAEEYEKDNNCYPLPSLVACDPGTGLAPYLDKIPCDPVSGASYFYEYEDSVCPGWFRLYAVFENENDPDYLSGVGPGGAFNYAYSSPNAPDLEIVEGGGEEGGGEEGGGSIPDSGFYGCFSGACVPILWDLDRPGPECDPNYQNSSCYGECVRPENSCTPWH